jgi:hypothetical protein
MLAGTTITLMPPVQSHTQTIRYLAPAIPGSLALAPLQPGQLKTASFAKMRKPSMYKLIAFATLLSCLSLPAFAQSERPVAKAGEPLDFGHMSDRQVNEFVASELKELNDQAALLRSALTILLTLQATYALESDAAEPNQESAIGEKPQRHFKGLLSETLEDLRRSSTANDLERASAFRSAPPK